MNFVDKVKKAFYMLSLDITRSFDKELWLPSQMLVRIQQPIRSYVDSWIQQGSYFNESYPGIKKALTDIGSNDLSYLINWIDYVYINAGVDRVEEHMWDSLMGTIYNEKCSIDDVHISSFLSSTVSDNRIQYFQLKSKLQNHLGILTARDRKLIDFYGSEVLEVNDIMTKSDLVENYISLVSSRNKFVEIFYKYTKEYDQKMMDVILNWARKNADKAHLAPIEIVYPRSWEIKYYLFSDFWKQ
jgi:hypothetical protein